MVLNYTTSSTSGSNVSVNGFNAAITPAISANIKNGFAINFNVGDLSYTTVKPTGGTSINTFNLGFGQGLSFGISKNFSHSKK